MNRLTLAALFAGFVIPCTAFSAVTWQFDGINSVATLNADSAADNLASPLFFDTDIDSASGYGPGAPNSVECTVLTDSNDSGFMPTFDTSSSTSGLARFEDLNTPTVTFTFNAVNVCDTIDGDGFATSARVTGDSTATLLFDNFLVPTPVQIDYSWQYDAIANPDHEAGAEDPEFSSGTLSLTSSSGMAPGGLFGVLNPGPFTISDSDTGGWTETINPGDSVTITMSMEAQTNMASPGVGPSDQDLAGAAFRGQLVLSITTIPEPTTLTLLAAGSLLMIRRKR